MNHHHHKYHRRSIRLPGYDYASVGGYFVTICVDHCQCDLGRMLNGKMVLSSIGQIAYEFWEKIPQNFPHVQLDQFIIMPNHVHGILFLVDDPPGSRGVQLNAPTANRISPVAGSFPVIIRTYKAAVTKWCRGNGFTSFSWQRNYYEHIIRNDRELKCIRQYITDNPIRWELDKKIRNMINIDGR